MTTVDFITALFYEVDEQLRLPPRQIAHRVKVPHFVEKTLAHDWPRFWLGGSGGATYAPSLWLFVPDGDC